MDFVIITVTAWVSPTGAFTAIASAEAATDCSSQEDSVPGSTGSTIAAAKGAYSGCSVAAARA